MVDNTSITPGTGESIRDKDRAGVKTQVVGIDVAIGTGTEALLSTSNPMPVSQTTSIPAGTNTVGAFKKAPAATGTITSVTSAAASTLLLAANANRLGATFYNESTSILYLALAGSASTTAYTVQLTAGAYYELPNDGCGYVGSVYGIWSAANGFARVTELT